MSEEASQYAKKGIYQLIFDNRTNITYMDIANGNSFWFLAINDVYEFEFLTDIVPLKLSLKDALKKRRDFEKSEQMRKDYEEAVGSSFF